MVRSRLFLGIIIAGSALVVSLCLALTQSAGNPANGASSGDLLPIVVQGLREAACSIRSGMGNVTVTNYKKTSEGVVETNISYRVAFLRDKFRYRGECTYNKNETCPDGPYKTGAIHVREAAYDGNRAVRYDHTYRSAVISTTPDSPQKAAWEFNFRWPCRGTLDLDVGSIDKMIEDGLHVARREVLNGHECIVLEISKVSLSGKDNTPIAGIWQYWVDTQAGYTITKSQWYASGGIWGEKSLRAEWQMQARDYGSGFWVPVEYSETYYTIDSVTSQPSIAMRKIVTYDTDFRFNVEIRNEDLAIELPSGTHVRDEVVNAEYTIP